MKMASVFPFDMLQHPVKLVALIFICKLMTSTCQQFNCTGSSSEFKCFSEGFNGQCISRIQICNSIPDCIDGSDETKVTCPEGLAPNSWMDNWHRSNIKLSLVNIDDHVAVYWDWAGKTYENFTWLFRLVSSAWKYAKDSYGPIGNDTNPLLYVVLHTNETESCRTYTSLTPASPFRNLIDCRLRTNSEPVVYNSLNFQKMVFSIGRIVKEGAKGIFNNADQRICGEIMRYIIEYDIYRKSQGTSVDVISWRDSKINFTANGNFCFKNWYLPIYETYGGVGVGGVRVLNNYFTLTKSHWPKHTKKGYTTMNLGDFVHFWSESAGTNLQSLALNAFKRNEDFHLTVARARKLYIFQDNVAQTPQYTDGDVGIYFKNYPIYPDSTYKTISDAWKHVKINYFPAKQTKYVRTKLIGFYNEKLSSHKRCSSITNSITADKRARDRLYVIDCVASSNERFYDDASGSALIGQIIMEMRQMALNVTGGLEPESWPAFNVSGRTMASILVYDIYKGLRMSLEADEWEAKVDKLEPSPRPDKYWFRDWYKTIYNKQSNQRGKTNVLKEFLLMVSNRTSGLQINLGEFVHFWSMAAKTDLQELATLYLGWNETHRTEFVQARKDYPNLPGYLCDECDQLPTTENIKPAESQEGNLIPIVAGVSAFGVALLIFAFVIKIYMDRKKIKSLTEQVRNLSDEEVDEFYKGNPNLVVGTDAHAPIQAMPFNMNYEIPRERLSIDDKKVLGSGEFGLVKQGLLKGDPNSGRADTTVAVKMVKPSMDVIYFKAHLSEIKIMAFLGEHENIASLVGTITSNIKNGEVFVVMEFCAKGDLRRHLKENGKNFVDLFRKRKAAGKAGEKQVVQATYTNAPQPQCTYTNAPAPAAVVQIEPCGGGASGSEPTSNHKNSRLSTLNLLQWSRQIAHGMAYLKAKHVIHGDLAARNVLIGSNDVAKISDFGLSRQLVNYSNYKKTNTETPLPWRWLAIESLENMIFSPQSDVWAFGVTLWEIFTLGKIPYPGKTWNQEFVDGLMAGQLLPSPTLGNQEIYNIILCCMKTDPSERISLAEIISQLETVEVNLSYF